MLDPIELTTLTIVISYVSFWIYVAVFFFLINLGKDLEILFPLFKAQISLPFAIFVFTFYFGIFFL